MVVLNPEIIANTDHFLAHLVMITTTPWSSKLAIVLALIASFCSSSWHGFFSL
jgi:hypothetical protein